jgi:6-bladed beta-propeller
MKTKRFHPLILLALAVVTAFGACRRERSFTATTKDGVRVVHNLRPASPEAVVRLQFVRQVGRLEAEAKEEMFAFPIHAARDDGGNLYVLDSKDNCIKKFDPDGRFLLEFGRHGQGPGEFQYPLMLGIAGKNRLLVHGMDSAVQIFDFEGRFVERFQLGEYDGLFLKGMDSGRVVGYAMNPGGENVPENKILKIFDLQGKALYHFGEPLLLAKAMDSWNANFLSLAVDGEDHIYAAFTYQNRIEKYAPDGRLLMTIDRALSFPVEHKTVMETMEIRGQARQVERLRSTLVSRGIGVDARGRIWVLTATRQPPGTITRDTYVPQEYSAFEVYEPDGVLRGRVPLPEILKSFDNFFMSGDSVFFLDPYGQCCVFEFKVAAGTSRP